MGLLRGDWGREGGARSDRHQMRWLADAAYPEAERVRVVLDNPVSSTGQALNTHRPACLYEAFEPKEARRVIQRLEFHYTPKHGSWLNMAEKEAARLQSFPDWFTFRGNKRSRFKQIGNAVPPLLSLAVARALKERLIQQDVGGHLENRYPKPSSPAASASMRANHRRDTTPERRLRSALHRLGVEIEGRLADRHQRTQGST